MESGVEFVAADMPGATPFMLHVYAAVAEEERRMISQRTKDAMKAAKARGIDLGRTARQNQELATDHAMLFRPILRQLQSEGFVTIRAITAALNERGVPSRDGGCWHLRSTQMMLKRLS
jgi:DNA invertase Pin-like site-specific DNA recombinase